MEVIRNAIMKILLIVGICCILNAFYYNVISPSISDDISLSTVNEKDTSNRSFLRLVRSTDNWVWVSIPISFLIGCAWSYEDFKKYFNKVDVNKNNDDR